MTRVRCGIALVVSGTVPVLAQQEIEGLLHKLDAACQRSDSKGWLAHFRSDNAELHELAQRRLEQMFTGGRRWQSNSSVCEPPRPVGDHHVILVHTKLRPLGRTSTALQSWYLVLDRNQTPTMAIDVCEEGLGHIREDTFSCPPCNYRMGTQGWLPVPLPPERAETHEAVSFYLPGSDLVCDVSVHLDREPMSAISAAEELATGMRTLVPGARAAAAVPWFPPSLGGKAPVQFTGARMQVDLPAGRRCIVHVDALGTLRHVLLLRGTTAALDKHRADVDRLLSSYEVIDLEPATAELAAKALFAHTGGRLEGNRYLNERHRDLTCSGPEGWPAELQSGGCRFRVVWRCPEDRGRMWLTGLGPPCSMPQWDQELAGRWLEQLCESRGLVISSQGEWAKADGFLHRTSQLRPGAGGGESGTRLLRLVLRPDLLVVLDGYLHRSTDPAELLRAFATLSMK